MGEIRELPPRYGLGAQVHIVGEGGAISDRTFTVAGVYPGFEGAAPVYVICSQTGDVYRVDQNQLQVAEPAYAEYRLDDLARADMITAELEDILTADARRTANTMRRVIRAAIAQRGKEADQE